MSKTFSNFSLADLLPEALRNEKQIQALNAAIDPELRILFDNWDLGVTLARLDELSSLQLDHLAIGYDAVVWRESWPLSTKRSVLKTVIINKRRKGTVLAVKQALEAIGSSVKIVEWWQTNPKGTPHTFKIYVSPPAIDGAIETELQSDVMALVDDAKPARSLYDFIMLDKMTSGINVYACIRPLTFKKIQ